MSAHYYTASIDALAFKKQQHPAKKKKSEAVDTDWITGVSRTRDIAREFVSHFPQCLFVLLLCCVVVIIYFITVCAATYAVPSPSFFHSIDRSQQLRNQHLSPEV